MQWQDVETSLRHILAPVGFTVFGWFELANGPPDLEGNPAVLIGNRGPAMWDVFSRSDFIGDGCENPLDRWTRSIIQPIADDMNAAALYPFLSGQNVDQHWPFQQWAKAARGLKQAPPGLLIDPEYGLWHAFRAVLVFDVPVKIAAPVAGPHPCNDCTDKPCLTSCPVGAISLGRFDANVCIDHVLSAHGEVCSSKGCIARNSCPVGRNHAYSDAQQAFHMRAYSNI